MKAFFYGNNFFVDASPISFGALTLSTPYPLTHSIENKSTDDKARNAGFHSLKIATEFSKDFKMSL